MSNEDVVRAKHPEAESQYFKPVVKAELARDRSGYWQIYPSPGLGVQPIGEGETDAAAGPMPRAG